MRVKLVKEIKKKNLKNSIINIHIDLELHIEIELILIINFEIKIGVKKTTQLRDRISIFENT